MKQKLAIFLPFILCALVFGCAPESILLVNLQTNDLRYCRPGDNSNACIARLEKLGYVRADRLAPEQKASIGLLPPY